VSLTYATSARSTPSPPKSEDHSATTEKLYQLSRDSGRQVVMWNSCSASVVDIALLRERQVSLSARVTLQNAFLDEPERSTNATFEGAVNRKTHESLALEAFKDSNRGASGYDEPRKRKRRASPPSWRILEDWTRIQLLLSPPICVSIDCSAIFPPR